MYCLFGAIDLRRALILLSLPVLVGLVIGVAVSRAEDRPRLLPDWLIAVDAGHGGDEKGAWFPTHELVEKDINLDVARNLGKVLARDGAAVVLIREDDTFVQLSERVNKAKNTNARMFVSIHVNRYPEDRSCCGAQVFYRSGSSDSQRLAELVQAQLRSIDVINTRHELPANYRVLRDSVVPAILVEIGFATNSRDRELLMSPHYRKDVIYAIRNGVIEFVRGKKTEPGGNPRLS